MGDFSAKTLSGSLVEAGIELQRLKTGTPPRILGRSINFSGLEEQKGDDPPTLFAFHDTRDAEDLFHVERTGEERTGWKPGTDQISCWITYTSDRTAEIVRNNLKRSALYGGEIRGIGPRYCPSIEDKFVRFADKSRHILFLEPEGRSTNEYYINGLSTSLPFDIQIELVHSVSGLERATILRPAYAVEYDFAPPTQLEPSLESKKVENLFFAGQINGTSGYEEAAGQGIVAGINAVCKIRGQPPLLIGREDGYIGVLIDDLVTKGTNEPYRMFTSRAEYRLLFNHGSAELRMLKFSEHYKVISNRRLQRIREKKIRIENWVDLLESDRRGTLSSAELLRQGDNHASLPPEFLRDSEPVKKEVLYRVRYRGYLERDLRQIEKLKTLEHINIPKNVDYMSVRGLRRESAIKLNQLRPFTLGQASRISGVSPADISILMVMIQATRQHRASSA